MVETHVALLRGINVGGKNKLPMKDLLAIFEHAGAQDVRTYIQSGNVVFTANRKAAAPLADIVVAEIKSRLGLTVPIVLRSQSTFEAAHDENPYRDCTSDPRALHVVFLRDHPSKAAVATLAHDHSPPDEFTVQGREIFLYCPRSLGRSKLTTAYFDKRLGTVATIRNWNTVRALVDLCQR